MFTLRPIKVDLDSDETELGNLGIVVLVGIFLGNINSTGYMPPILHVV